MSLIYKDSIGVMAKGAEQMTDLLLWNPIMVNEPLKSMMIKHIAIS